MTAQNVIPSAALDDRLGFVGTAGSGKTYNAGTGVERLLARKSRCVIVDPLGVWYGLRLMADGKTPSPFDVAIFGGAHGDLPLNERAGALIGEAVAGMAESCILDLSQLGTAAAERRFMLAFLTAIYRKAAGEPVHLIFDEADLWAPQRLLDKEGDAAKLLGQMETIVRRGRIKGFIPWLITQRPAVLSKNVLSQIDGLVALKLTSTQDRDAIGDWVEGQADKAQWNRLYGQLAAFQRGHGLVWVPGRGILKDEDFPAKLTFDSSATPKRGEHRRGAELRPLNVEALKTKLAAVAQEAEANDPRKLRAKIAELERQAAARGNQIDAEAVKGAEESAFAEGMRQGRLAGEGVALDGLRQLAAGIKSSLGAAVDVLGRDLGAALEETMNAAREKLGSATPVSSSQYRGPSIGRAAPGRASREHPPGGAPTSRRAVTNGAGELLPRGERLCLTAIAQHVGGVTREQLTVLTGYKRSSRDTYLQRLRERGLIEQQGERIIVAGAGMDALGPDFEPLPAGAELQRYWLERLPEGERRMLELLIERYPNATVREWLSDRTGYKRSSRDTYLRRLSSRELVTSAGAGQVRAADHLFDGA